MVRLHPSSPGRVVVEMFREEPTLYLDHWAIREISSNRGRRDRLLAALETRGTLLFSAVHIAELARNTGNSSDAIRSLLDAIGPHWMVTLANPIEVIRRETTWTVGSQRAPFVADMFFKTSGFLAKLSSGPVSLSHLVDMVQDEGSEAILASLTPSVQTLIDNLNRFRQEYRANNGILASTFTAQVFDERHPTRFVFHQLMRSLITTQVKLSPNHIADFFHAVVPLAYAQIVVLDKHWATQAENLHLPENWVRIFKKSNMDGFFDLLEQMPSVRGKANVPTRPAAYDRCDDETGMAETQVVMPRSTLMTDYSKYYDLEHYLFAEVGPRFQHEGHLSAFDFFCIVIWKANRSKSKVARRLLAYGHADLGHAVGVLTREIATADHPRPRLQVLIDKWGFRLPMASAILTVLYPDDFTVYDVRVCRVLGDFGDAQYKKFDGLWNRYEQFVARVRSEAPGKVTLREKDRYLWGRSFEEQLTSDISHRFLGVDDTDVEA